MRSSFFVYASVGSEVDTAAIVARLKAAGKRVCLPRLFGKSMKAVRDEGTRRKNRFGIEEPKGEEDEPCEVVLTPLLAFDACGNRLGYGGGFYDRYFKEHPNAYRVGLAYEGQRAYLLPVDGRDEPLHAVITEKGVSFF